MDRSQCESFNTWVLPDMCKVINQENQLWSDIVAHTHPTIKCPMKPSTIKYVNATIDYSLLAHLPFEGYTWIIHIRVFKSMAKIRYRKRLLFCMLVEATITNNRRDSQKKALASTQWPKTMKFAENLN